MSIPPNEWINAHLDLGTGQLFPAGKHPLEDDGYGEGGNGIIQINEDDLRGWLSPQQPQPDDGGCDAAIMKRLKAGEQPGKHIDNQWKVFCENIRKDCGKTDCDRGYSDETIETVTRKFSRSFRST